MIINRNSLVATYKDSNNQTKTVYLADYITGAEVGFPKLWDADSGRNLAKKWIGSFDIFPKVICSFKPLKQTELEAIAPLLNASSQNITYYDPEKKQNVTIETYTGDWSTKSSRPSIDEPFNCSFIAINRRL